MKNKNLKVVFLLIIMFLCTSKEIYAEENLLLNSNIEEVKINNVEIYKSKYLKRDNDINVNFKNIISDEDQLMSFSASFYTISTLTAYTDIFNGLEIYISPYGMADCNAYAQPSVKKVSLAITDTYGPLRARYMHVESVLLHELGHVFQEELIKNSNCESLMHEYASYYDEFKNSSYSENLRKDWIDDIDESFAEDFKIYAGKRFFNRTSEFKKTNQVYNPDVENFFDKYFK